MIIIDPLQYAYLPSDVSLTRSFPPLVDTMRKTESENAAFLMLRALVLIKADVWTSVQPNDIGRAIELDLEAKEEPLTALARNPFFRPDFHRLVKDGFAVWLDNPANKHCPIEFTSRGVLALAKHVHPSKRGGT